MNNEAIYNLSRSPDKFISYIKMLSDQEDPFCKNLSNLMSTYVRIYYEKTHFETATHEAREQLTRNATHIKKMMKLVSDVSTPTGLFKSLKAVAIISNIAFFIIVALCVFKENNMISMNLEISLTSIIIWRLINHWSTENLRITKLEYFEKQLYLIKNIIMGINKCSINFSDGGAGEIDKLRGVIAVNQMSLDQSMIMLLVD